HKKKEQEQIVSYLNQKRNLSKLTEKTVLIVQDFTQVQCQKDSYQDLIFTIYSIDDQTKALKHSFYHYVAKSKNNNLFVIQTYKEETQCISTRHPVNHHKCNPSFRDLFNC